MAEAAAPVVVAPAPVFEPAPVVEAKPVAPAPVAAPQVVIEPVSLESVGLQMVETDPGQRPATTAPAEKPARQPRKPRVKPVVTEEPLQMVETRKD